MKTNYKKNKLNLLILNNFTLIETSPYKLLNNNYTNFNLTFKNFIFINFSLLWYFLLSKSYFMLRNTYQHIDFKNTLEFIISLTTNKYINFYPSNLLTIYSIYQLQLIKNKKMQNSWINRNSLQLLLLYKFNNLKINKYNKLINFKNIIFNIKGRAADLRWVKLRTKKYGNFSKKSYVFQESYNWESTNTFVTKWGTVSIKSKISFYKLYRIPQFYF